jgi:hypothetical protein
MKRCYFAFFTVAIVLTLITISLPGTMVVRPAAACGWGQGGGEGYVPQRRDGDNAYAARPAPTPEQAHQIIEQHVTRLNSALKVGPVNDAGDLFEAEIYSPDNEVVQVLGVEKRSGRLVVIN